MSSPGFDRIAANYEILIHIYKMLEFEDQLRLANVSRILRSVFASFVCKEDYQTLAVYGNHTHCVVANERGVNRKLLSSNGFQEFIGLYAANVRELMVYRRPLPDISCFVNITSLSFMFEGVFRRESLQAVANNFPNLEVLRIHPSNDGLRTESSVICLDVLLEMKKLRQLCLDHEFNGIPIKYQHFRRIVKELPVEYLKLSFPIAPQEKAIEDATSAVLKPTQLKELYIHTTFDPQKWSSNNLASFFDMFENLLILSVKVSDIVTDDILQKLAEACKQLDKLTIRRTRFSNIATFSIPPKLTELSLCHCVGLTKNNLKRLLTKYKIRTFVSRSTHFSGPFEDFRISPFLQKLVLDNLDLCKRKSFYDGNEHLKELMWHHSRVCFYCYGLGTKVPLASCLNLEALQVVGRRIEVDSLLQLKHLRKLEMHFSRDPMQWPYIVALLTHMPLRELIIGTYPCMSYKEMAEGAPAEGFPSNVTSLRVHVAIFELAIDFWLDLFNRNTNMKLVILQFHNVKLLQKLINHRYMPRNLRTIDVFGFTINCNDLRSNFEIVTENLEPFIGLNMNSHRAIFCRNENY